MLSSATVQAAYRQARGVLSGSTTTVRIEGQEYQGTRVALELTDEAEASAAFEEAESGVRLDISELKKPYPKTGDQIQVKEPDSDDWKDRRVVATRFDHAGGTVLAGYGERYG
tara:strand:- start:788 stop:1126 length:339 start_codon:yes stop_codon:yes gene_type:complete